MRFLFIAALFPLLALGSAAAPAGQAPDDPTPIQPGQWEMVTKITALDVPGAPEEIVQQMRASLADQRNVESQCITPEQARNPSANMIGSQNPAGCEFSDTTWTGGAVRIRATCRPPGSPAMQMAIDGTYTALQIDNRIELNMDMAGSTGAEAPMHIRLQGRTIGRRTGACTTPRVEPRPERDNLVAPVD